MIKYHQLEKTSDEFPPDIELVTDDSAAEMAAIEVMVEETEFEIEIPEDREGDGFFHIIIPGVAAGDFAECVYDIDGGMLDELTEKLNQEAVERDNA